MSDHSLRDLARSHASGVRYKNGVLSITVVLPAGQQKVWERLTVPQELASWSPVVPNRPLTSCGPATSAENPSDEPVDASVLDVREPWFLQHRWGSHILTWALAPAGEGTQLNLVDELDDPGMAPQQAAGWALCLAVLEDQLSGQATARCVGQDALEHGWAELRDDYAARFDTTETGSA
ncbi:SRPBCC domain-containing protein [Luteococcus sp. OSA5]|uniref:SRPBCC domain-containing protein n=1 Tax=Luteococcus sp. OSA5 TaxID=3401630 RepID=UPI003B42B74B